MDKSKTLSFSARPADSATPDRPRRAILSLKNPPLSRLPASKWKCKPCGTTLEVRPDLAPDTVIRCLSCNARLGRAADFASTSTKSVRARRA